MHDQLSLVDTAKFAPLFISIYRLELKISPRAKKGLARFTLCCLVPAAISHSLLLPAFTPAVFHPIAKGVKIQLKFNALIQELNKEINKKLN